MYDVKVMLKLIGQYREKLPLNSQGNKCEVMVPSNSSVDTLLTRFGIPTNEESVILINGLTPKEDQILFDGDEITVFPAMAGG